MNLTGRPRLARQGAVALFVAIALAARAALQPWFGDQLPFVTLLPAVAAGVWYAGAVPAAVGALLGFVAASYLFVAPRYSLEAADLLGTPLHAIYLTAFALLIALGELARRQRIRAQRSKKALSTSEARYRAIVESQAEMICRFRADGTILFANGGYARARGTTSEALVGSDFWQFIPAEDRAGVRAMLDGLTPQAPEVRIENRFRTTEGERWTLWTNRALAFDAGGRWAEAQSTGIDITDRKEAEQALREADQRKNEFLAVLGHELRNPLAPLRTGLELLRADATPELVERVRPMMERQLSHLVRLVDDLLDLSRISRGQIVLRRAPLDLHEAIEAALELTRPLIEERRHELVVECTAEPLPLEGDFQRLTQVLGNLLGNAAKYTDPGGTIRLTAAVEAAEAVISVRDTGFGIPPEYLERLFEMFSQVPEHYTRVGGGGLGIGLALSRQLAELHGGTIVAASDGTGHGSEFCLRLPLTAPADVPREAQRARHVVSDLG